MNKNIISLILGVILVCAQGGVYANCCQSSGCPIDGKTSCSCAKNSTVSEPKKAKSDAVSAIKFRKYVNKVRNNRATVYNALNLSDEQIKVHEKLIEGDAYLFDEKFDKLIKESYKVKALKKANALDKDINAQKKVVQQLKDDINDLLEQEEKEFKKCLTRQQRSKYAMIKKLERKSYKESQHEKDYYKNNPQMRPFGNPKPCSCKTDN